MQFLKLQYAHSVLDGVTCQCQLVLPVFLSIPEPFLGFLPAGEQRRQHGAHNCKLSSVGHQVAWLLGTSCCLTTGGGHARTVGNASPARGPQLLAGAKHCWAATLALPACSPWMDALAGPWGRPLPRQLCCSLRESTGRCCRFKLFPYYILHLGWGCLSST